MQILGQKSFLAGVEVGEADAALHPADEAGGVDGVSVD